ncbi:hypothetical protein [Streptosporangium sp. NPDC023615]|uniref:hypothetical protein n=1 Tax=Streptosporangium sp. NPDC023615 TaxID=3154794 RepID=UPI00341F5517
MTAALFVLIAVVFTIPFAIEIVTDDCRNTLRFTGRDIIAAGPVTHCSGGAALVVFLSLLRRDEADRHASVRRTPRPLEWDS